MVFGVGTRVADGLITCVHITHYANDEQRCTVRHVPKCIK